MAYCKECSYFSPIPENADDYVAGKGDCVREERDDKGKYWLSKPTGSDHEADKCEYFKKKLGG